MQSKWDYVLCWVLALGAGVSSPADTACAIFWLFPFLSKEVAAGSCPGLGLKKNTCGGRGLGACCVSAPSLKGSRWVWHCWWAWQAGRSSTNCYFCLPWPVPKTLVYPRQGLKGAFWCFPNYNSASVRIENCAHLGRRRNHPHVLESDGEKGVPGLLHFLG